MICNHLWTFDHETLLIWLHKCTFNRGDELYANDLCESQFESQDIFSHLSKNNCICMLFSELNDSKKLSCFQNNLLTLYLYNRQQYIIKYIYVYITASFVACDIYTENLFSESGAVSCQIFQKTWIRKLQSKFGLWR